MIGSVPRSHRKRSTLPAVLLVGVDLILSMRMPDRRTMGRVEVG
jgi:hypothetical protein